MKQRPRYLLLLLGSRMGDLLMRPIAALCILVFAMGGLYLSVKLVMSIVNAM